jgi:hypothetical protein
MSKLLNRKQLEDAAKCSEMRKCDTCSNYEDCPNPFDTCYANEAAAQTALTAIDMLKRLEWKSSSNENCPYCGASKIYEGVHKPDCELGNLLKEVDSDAM